MSIVNDCMIVNLQIGTWTGSRLDKEASKRVTDEAHADEDAARVSKRLVPRESLNPIVSAANTLRAHFYANTLPWKDNGDRLLTRKRYTSFMQEHSEKARVFHDAVDTFLTHDYPKAMQRADFRMGTLFRADEYPMPSELRDRFYIRLDIDAVSDADDIRVKLSSLADRDQVIAHAEQAMQQRINRAMRDVWDRLAKVMTHFANKMAADEVFRDSTVHNLEDIVNLLPDLNVLGDPELERIRADIKNTIIGYDPVDLRKDPVVRNHVAAEAQRIVADMEGFMNAFGKAAE